jgi:DNA invertase Pin-like site-specific DNA recombinase/transposase
MPLSNKEKEQLRNEKNEWYKGGNKKRVAPLMRVSTYKQAHSDDTVPIPVQRDKLLKWINEQPDWELAMVNGEPLEYIEISSAYKISRKDRELIKSTLSDAEKNLYDVIVFFKHDRLSRISEEYITILQDYWNLGVEPWDYEKRIPLVVKTPSDKLVRTIEGFQAENESYNTSFRVYEHMSSYAEEGMWMGGNAPYGYRYKDPVINKVKDKSGKNRRKVRRGIEINPDEAKLVRLIFELYISGYGSKRICGILNNPPHNLRKRNGKPFDHTLILDIIKNPIYIGIPTWGKTSNQDKYFKSIPEEDWFFSKEKIEKYRIIDDKTWQKAKEILDERRKQVKKGKPISTRSLASDRLLAGLVFCGYCGAPLLSHNYKSRDYKLSGYVCRSEKRKYPCESTYGFWRADHLDNLVLDVVIENFAELFTLDTREIFEKAKNQYNKTLQKESDETIKLKSSIKRLSKLKEYYINKFNRLLLGEVEADELLPQEVIGEQLKNIQEQLNDANERLSELKPADTKSPLDEKLLQEIIDDLRSWDKILLAADITIKKTMLSQVIDSIIVYDEEIQINLNYNLKEMVNNVAPSLASFIPDRWGIIPMNKIIKYTRHKKTRSEGAQYWKTVRKWEKELGKPFGEIIAELRLLDGLSPKDVIKKLGVSKGFIYYHFPEYMNRITYLEKKYQKKLSEVVLDMRNENKTMPQIAEILGLSISALYLHLRKIGA